ncbi:MAG TPA: hypothetical protein VGJ09_03475 [Bryobacteraceae bacterium]|jgi:hypothetical protein
MRTSLRAALLTLCALSAPLGAQWFDQPTKGIPRTPDGKANLTAPAPKTPDGKPDLSGIWLGDQWAPAGRRPATPGAGRGGGAPEMQPWAQQVFNERRSTSLRDDPEARCMPQGVPKASTLPYPFEIVNANGKTLILFEMYSLRRQIFTDGRALPKDYAQPSWMGYSIGKWDGDEFVVTTAGVNDQVWNIDLAGHPHSDALRITERYKRVDFGHMDVLVTIDDSKTYAKQWNMPVMRYTLLPDTDLFEFVCEKNIDPQHMGAK